LDIDGDTTHHLSYITYKQIYQRAQGDVRAQYGEVRDALRQKIQSHICDGVAHHTGAEMSGFGKCAAANNPGELTLPPLDLSELECTPIC